MSNRRPIWRATFGNAWIAIVAGLFFLAVGAVVTLVGTSIWLHVAQSKTWALATATVLDRELLQSSKSVATLFKVEFTDAHGQKHQAQGTWNGNHLSRQTVELLYNPADPSQTLFDSDSKKSMAKFMTGLGSAVLLASIFLTTSGIRPILQRRRENRQIEEAKATREAHRTEKSS